MSGNKIGRKLAAVPPGDAASRIGRICAVIAFLSVTLVWASAAPAFEWPNTRLSDDVALTKATVALLAAKDFPAVRERLDPKLGQPSDDTLGKMSDQIGPDAPASVETISSNGGYNLKTGDGNIRIILEYGLAGKWVVVDAVVTTKGDSKRFTRLYLTRNTLPLKELNGFRLFGKGPVQYLFLAAWIAVIALTVLAMVRAFKRHRGWRRWGLVFLMPLGLTPTTALNWNTAQLWVLEAPGNGVIPVVSLRYPGALWGYTEFLVPYFYISAPLIAFGYLIWHWRWLQRQDPAASSPDSATP